MKVHSFGTQSVVSSIGAYKGRPAILIWNEKHKGEAGKSYHQTYPEMSWLKRWWIRRKCTIITFNTPERAALACAALQSDQAIAEMMVHMSKEWTQRQDDLQRSTT